MATKKYIALCITIIALAGGAFLSQGWFVQMHGAQAAARADATTFIADADGAVLDAMDSLAADGKISFSGREFPGLGFFVEEINGTRNANGRHWMLYVNGAFSDKGASQARVERGDVIEWRYE